MSPPNPVQAPPSAPRVPLHTPTPAGTAPRPGLTGPGRVPAPTARVRVGPPLPPLVSTTPPDLFAPLDPRFRGLLSPGSRRGTSRAWGIGNLQPPSRSRYAWSPFPTLLKGRSPPTTRTDCTASSPDAILVAPIWPTVQSKTMCPPDFRRLPPGPRPIRPYFTLFHRKGPAFFPCGKTSHPAYLHLAAAIPAAS